MDGRDQGRPDSANGERDDRRNVWLFQANPKYFDLTAALKDARVGDRDDWSVTGYRSEMQADDIVVLWQAGKEAGIYAIGTLLGEPRERDWEPTEEEVEQRPYLKAQWRVAFRYTHILDEPITRDFLKEHPILRNLSVIKFANATNFRVTPEEWTVIEQLLDGPPSSRNCWKISPGEKAYAWNDFLQRGVIAVG